MNYKVMELWNFKQHILILLIFSLFVSTSYAEDWLCVDGPDDSIYKVKRGSDVINYIYPSSDTIKSKTFKVLKNDRDDMTYAISPLELTPSAKADKDCFTCLMGQIIAIDMDKKKINQSMISYGFKGKDGVIYNEDERGGFKTIVWESEHKCQLDK